jgi:hypothetical protein
MLTRKDILSVVVCYQFLWIERYFRIVWYQLFTTEGEEKHEVELQASLVGMLKSGYETDKNLGMTLKKYMTNSTKRNWAVS